MEKQKLKGLLPSSGSASPQCRWGVGRSMGGEGRASADGTTAAALPGAEKRNDDWASSAQSCTADNQPSADWLAAPTLIGWRRRSLF